MKIIIDDELYQADLSNPLDISIPMQTGGANPNCYFSERPSFKPIVMDGFTGSVAQGGACNHQRVSFSPHGNGTHTECYGHLSTDPEATINQCLKTFHFIAKLISVEPEETESSDRVIRWDSMSSGFANAIEALIIRTLPNDPDKTTRQYSGTNPPYLERRLAQKAAEKGVSHLLIDLPSVDRENDDGELMVHRDFWNYPNNPRKHCTITELIFVPDHVDDGLYLLNLQIASLESDASPSKPVLYRISRKPK